MNETIPLSDNIELPFVGRQIDLAKLQQQIIDPPHRHALVFTGHSGMGKTTFLTQVATTFRDPILPILITLDESLSSGEELLRQIIDATNTLLDAYNFSLSRVPSPTTEDDLPFLDWFNQVYLPEVMQIIRPHRRVVWLFDEAQHLDKYDESFISYCVELLEREPRLSMVMAISTDYDDVLENLKPLVNPVEAQRIHRLNRENSQQLITDYAPGISEDISNSIWQATGGHPRLLARFGQTLQHYRAQYGDNDAFQHTKPDVYEKSSPEFRQMWMKLPRNERLVLTAIASLIYHDPSRSVSAREIETWLVETDYLLDIIAINAALRSLDYADIVTYHPNEGIRLSTGLMQRWLIEQARLEDDTMVRGRLPLIIGVGIAIVIIILIAFFAFAPANSVDTTPTVPTATLST